MNISRLLDVSIQHRSNISWCMSPCENVRCLAKLEIRPQQK